MTPDEVRSHVRSLDGAVVTTQRPDGGWELSRGGIRVGVAPNPHSGALQRCVEDAVVAIRLIAAPRPPALSPDEAGWRAAIEQRLTALEQIRPPKGQKANT